MNTGLTTFDGFPRADIDVAQIRTTRARIVRLKNDYKDVMAKLEVAVHEQADQPRVAEERAAVRVIGREDEPPRVTAQQEQLEPDPPLERVHIVLLAVGERDDAAAGLDQAPSPSSSGYSTTTEPGSRSPAPSDFLPMVHRTTQMSSRMPGP